jgi:predicted phage tail protein
MMRAVHLHGAAGRRFGRRFMLDVETPAEAVRALISLRPGARQALREGAWRVIVGRPRLRNAIAVEHLGMHAGSQPIHIVPAHRPQGGGDDKSIGAIIIGVVLIGAAIALAPVTGGLSAVLASSAFGAGLGISTGTVVLLGASMILGGISALLTTPPDAGNPTDSIRSDDRPSFLFGGVTNNSQQGGPVPLVIGTHMVGSIVVMGGLNAEDIT